MNNSVKKKKRIIIDNNSNIRIPLVRNKTRKCNAVKTTLSQETEGYTVDDKEGMPACNTAKGYDE